MATIGQPLQPSGTVTVAASTATATAKLSTGGDACLIYNATTGIAFVRMDAGPATAADTPVPPGARLLLNCPPTVTNCAVILSAGSGNVYFTRGNCGVY
jgi:hypothetical protein